MNKQYLFSMFVLCFFIWAVLVDNLVLPSDDALHQNNGTYTRYRVKKWDQGGKLDLIKDEILVYAIVNNRERHYYLAHKPYFEATLKNLPEGTPIQIRYKNGFPKIWKKSVYSLNKGGIPFLRFSSAQMLQQQRATWKLSGIMVGVYLFLVGLGFINKPKRK